MLILRKLLPVCCAAFSLAVASAVVPPLAEPAGRVSGPELQVATPLAATENACLAAPGDPRLAGQIALEDQEHLLCVDTIECGSCCAPRGQLKRFWDCCKGGGGLECEARCNQRRP